MTRAVRILLVEDSEDDAKLALLALRRGGFDTTHQRVQTAEALSVALAAGGWDAVISDYAMPSFSGIEALRIFRETGLDIPFILVSGTIGEQLAVAAMKGGASDYVMKASLERLAPALERELKETQTRAENRRARDALHESELRFRQVAENIRDVFLLSEADGGQILYASPAYEQLWGRTCASLYADPGSWVESIHLEDREAAREAYRSGMATGNFQVEFRIVSADGPVRWMEVRAFPVRDKSGAVARIASIVSDVTERTVSGERIRRLNRVYAMLSGINALTVRVRDRGDLFREACEISIEEGGFQMAWIAMLDKATGVMVPCASAGTPGDFYETIRDGFKNKNERLLGASLVGTAIRERKATFCNDVEASTGLAFKPALTAFGTGSVAVLPLQIADESVGVFTLYAREADFFDETELKLLMQLAGDVAYAIDHIDKQAQLDYLASYDVLTGLANRRLFLERLTQYQRSAQAGGHKVAMYLVDIERFKNINDTLGQPAGDMLLRQVAEWLIRYVGDANLLARVGADQFAVILPQARGANDAARLLDRTIREFIGHPFQLNDVVLRVAAKIGVALYPDDGDSADALFMNAEAALKKAKASGNGYLFYTQKMTDAVSGKLALENALHRALANDEFVLHYQPKVNLATGKLTSAEALIRWNDPQTGLVPPGRFIPILEETGLIHEVGRWAMRQALRDYLRWQDAGLPAVRIAVNVSPLQLRNRGFVDEIGRVLAVDPRASAGLELELTESLIMEDVDQNISSLQAIRALGVTISIDDFGTGFSSLSYLARLPVDTLKIDRVFVVDMTTGRHGMALVSAIITLAHSLKLKVVAEGVETEEQAKLLRLLNCDEMQGYLFSKPVAADTFERNFLAPQPSVSLKAILPA